ncbi:MAG: LPS-assembly protein LptD [Candidatus Omnitrophica bacterium]|nr:LPS-assembly protein LptD [Candidatus Omnitrophota bacterium]
MGIGRLTRRPHALAGAALCGVLLLPAAAGWGAETVSEEIVVRGDHVEYHEAGRTVIGHGHIVVTYQDVTLTCDRAVVYLETHDAFLSGRIHVEQPGGTLRGDEAVYNFETKKGTLLKAAGRAGPWQTVGDRVDKVADHGFVAREGYLTSCEFDPPHTRLQARQVRIIPDDRVILKNTVMYVGPVPVLYLPSYTHPLNDRRPRVTLTPGYSGEWGPFLLSSWRYFLHENLQGRILLDYRERRHWAEGVDTRYRMTEDSVGLLRLYYTHENRLEKGRRYFRGKKKKSLMSVRERYRFQWRHRWELDDETTATAELHKTKDDLFNEEYFRAEYEQDAHPKSYLEVIRSDPRYGVSLLARKRVNNFEAETERLPELRYDVRPTSIRLRQPWLLLAPWLEPEEEALVDAYRDRLGGAWYYENSNSYDAFRRKAAYGGTDAQVNRLDTFHQVSYQVRLLRALNVTPLINTRQTWYSRDAAGEGALLRGLFATGVDVSTKVFRVFDVDTEVAGIEIHRLRHVISPNVSYRYQRLPTVPPGRLLQLDSIDGANASHVITPSLEQALQTKRPIGRGRKLQSVNLVRFVLGTDYQLRTPANAGGRFSNVTESLEVRPYSWLYSEQHAEIDAHRHEFKSASFDVVAGPDIGHQAASGAAMAANVSPDRPDDPQAPWYVGVGWRWLRDQNAQVALEAVVNLTPKWRIGIYERADLRRINSDGSKFVNRPAESEFRLRRDLHEWTVELVVNRRRAEGSSFLLLFRLKAAPEQPLEFQRSYNRPKLGGRRALFAG